MPRLSLAKLERHLYSAADRWRQEVLDAAFPALGLAHEFLHNLPKRKKK
jgi:hypothetical protein